MQLEAGSVGLALLFLGLVGIGPALHLVSCKERRFYRAAAIAPVLGFSILSLLTLPLIRQVGPVREWAPPVAALLLVLSAALAYLAWRGAGPKASRFTVGSGGASLPQETAHAPTHSTTLTHLIVTRCIILDKE